MFNRGPGSPLLPFRWAAASCGQRTYMAQDVHVQASLGVRRSRTCAAPGNVEEGPKKSCDPGVGLGRPESAVQPWTRHIRTRTEVFNLRFGHHSAPPNTALILFNPQMDLVQPGWALRRKTRTELTVSQKTDPHENAARTAGELRVQPVSDLVQHQSSPRREDGGRFADEAGFQSGPSF